jgi:hypothetical protein
MFTPRQEARLRRRKRMSYIDQIVQSANTVCYSGPDNGTPLIIPGGLAARVNPGSGVLQFTNLTGELRTSFEAYNSVRFGNGGRQGFNYNNIAINMAAWNWFSLDNDILLTDGSETHEAIISASADADFRVWRITAWRPQPNKVVIIGTFDNTDTTVDGTVEGVVTEMHRISVNDSATPITSFNGQSYRIADGWIPAVVAYKTTQGKVTGGSQWRMMTPGLWGLVLDAPNVAIETHTADLVFRRYPPSSIRRFGNFTV